LARKIRTANKRRGQKAIKRHISQIRKNCREKDGTCRKKQRQAVLHWACDSREY